MEILDSLERQYLEEYELRFNDYLHKALAYSPYQREDIPPNEVLDDEELEDLELQNAEEEAEGGFIEGEENLKIVLEEEQKTVRTATDCESAEISRKKGDEPRKHIFLTRSYYLLTHDGAVDREDTEYYLRLCKKVRNNEEKADFVIIILIRLLYLLKKRAQQEGVDGDPDHFLNRRITRLVSDFSEFSFWTTSNHKSGQMPSVIFWSENHTFMYLSTAYLLQQFLPHALRTPEMAVTEKEGILLEIYLDAHCHDKFKGVYEVLSTTYLPYTLCSLFNLYDFAEDIKIKQQAKEMIDQIVCSFTLVANRSGLCNLTASARQYAHTRLRNYGHNINQLMYLVTGVSIDGFKPTSIVDFLLTSSWRPPLQAIQNFMSPEQYRLRSSPAPQQRSGSPGFFLGKRMNHATREIREIYEKVFNASHKLKNIHHLTPFYWSAGLVTHPRFIEDTLAYQRKHNLLKNPGISSLTYVPKLIGKKIMKQVNHFSTGQNYTKVFLNVYKSPSRAVVMTSFENYNVGKQAYQQMPWMVNLDGVGIWSQSGKRLGVNVYGPSVKQDGNILLAVYCIHHSLVSDRFISLTWPKKYFDVEKRFSLRETSVFEEPRREYPPSWWFGQRNNCYIGVYCNKDTHEVTTARSDAIAQYFRGDPEYILPRRMTTHHKVYWLVVVGDDQTYDNLDQFCSYCWRIDKHDSRDRDEYQVRITPPDREPIVIAVDSTSADQLRL